MANEANLYSGLTPPARREVVKTLQEQPKPDPKAEVILDELVKMKVDILNINHFDVKPDTPDEVVRRQIQRNKDRYEDLTKLEQRFRKLLNIRPEKQA